MSTAKSDLLAQLKAQPETETDEPTPETDRAPDTDQLESLLQQAEDHVFAMAEIYEKASALGKRQRELRGLLSDDPVRLLAACLKHKFYYEFSLPQKFFALPSQGWSPR